MVVLREVVAAGGALRDVRGLPPAHGLPRIRPAGRQGFPPFPARRVEETPPELPADPMVTRVYDELRALARGRMAALAPGQTLQATGLVHEAWLRLAETDATMDRSRFFGAAAQAMR